MAVTTAVFPKASAAAPGLQIQRCAGAAMPGARGDAPAQDRGAVSADAVAAAAERVLVRERIRSQQLLSARPLPAVRRVVGAAPCPRSAPSRGYRLGRWERLGMTLVVAMAVAVVGFTSLGSSAAPARDAVVLPGDTLLSLALREMPDIDPARAVELIGEANGSANLQIAPGMTLAIPANR